MSITPAQWVDRSRRRERARLLNLVDRWEHAAETAKYNEGMFGAVAMEANLKQCAKELREVLDGRTTNVR